MTTTEPDACREMTIILSQGGVTRVSPEDYAALSAYNWQMSGDGYVRREVRKGNNKAVYLMHREIMNPPKGLLVDHANGDRLDNRRCNLRICTSAENNWNSRSRSGSSSQYKGVSWCKKRHLWESYINYNKKQYFLGRFQSETDAALAFNQAAIRYHGEFAKLNDIPTDCIAEGLLTINATQNDQHWNSALSHCLALLDEWCKSPETVEMVANAISEAMRQKLAEYPDGTSIYKVIETKYTLNAAQAVLSTIMEEKLHG